MKVQLREQDLSDDYLRFVAQVGADGIDIIRPEHVPGVLERGYADEAGLRCLLERIWRWELDVYRVHPPVPGKYLLGEAGGDREVDDVCRTLEVLGKAGVPFMYMPIELSHDESYRRRWANIGHLGLVNGVNRAGSTMLAFDPGEMRRRKAANPPALAVDYDALYERALHLYERLIPIAEAFDVRLITHPSDPPLPEAAFAPQRWLRAIEAAPSTHSGYLYCVGTRHETGVDVSEEIRRLGATGKIFQVDFRNVRGTISRDGGYREVMLDDGDIAMFRVLQALHAVGYDGGLAVDHLPELTADNAFQGMATAYAVGYMKALIAALET